MTDMFFQAKVEADGRIFDRGVVTGDGRRLHPTTVNTPPAGYYYVNEKVGLYIFAARDWRRIPAISYVEAGRSREKQFVGGPGVQA